MVLALLTFLTGIAISAVAIYYSVLGLASIFSGAVLPIIIMGTILEISKLVSAWWLKANWSRAPMLLKSYMLIATLVLMLITSMGIFGFLSKAHSDQSLATGDVSSQVAIYDEQIKIERENIVNAQSLIKQMDDAVTGIQANGSDREIKLRDGRTYTRSAAELALQTRRSQAKDRASLTAQIQEAQAKIVELQKQKAPIAAEQRKVEAEVGPIKYIAAFVYGDNPDQNLLEKAVTWVIITIVFVFDPLAVLLLLASQMSFQWVREQKQLQEPKLQSPVYVDEPPNFDDIKIEEENNNDNEQGWKESEHKPETHPYLRQGFNYPDGWQHVGPLVAKTDDVKEETVNEKQDEIPEKASVPEIKIVDSDTIQYGDIKVNKIGDNYFDISGKKMSADVFGYEYPELAKIFRQQQFKLQADNVNSPVRSSFGTQFPAQAEKGEMFLRVDAVPNRLYKFNGSKWIEVDKTRTDTYSYDEQYIQFLIEKLASGEYDLDQLSTSEQELVAEQLEKQNGKT